VAFDLYPDPHSAPLTVGAGGASPLIGITQRVAIDPSTGLNSMFVRITKVGTSSGPGGPPHPAIRLASGAGAVTEIPLGAGGTEVKDSLDPNTTPAAQATMVAEADDVYLLTLEVLRSQSQWRIQIGNTDTEAAHRFVWVVADSDAGSRQPWIDVTQPEPFDTVAGSARPRNVMIANYGTGKLRFDNADTTVLGSGYTLVQIAPREVTPNRSATAQVSFVPPEVGTAPVTVATEFVLSTNDHAAGQATGHDGHLALTATVTPQPRWGPGGVLVVGGDGGGLSRLDPASGALVPVGSGPLLSGARRIAVERNGDALVGADIGVVRVDRLTGEPTPVSVGHGLDPIDLVVEPDGDVLVLGRDRTIVRVDPHSGKPTPVTSGQLIVDPVAMALEAGGTVVVANAGFRDAGGGLVRVNPKTGDQATLSTDSNLYGEVGGPTGVTVQLIGTILVTHDFAGAGGGFEWHGTSIVQVDPGSGSAIQFPVHAGLQGVASIAVAPDGRIVVCDNSGLIRIEPVSGQGTTISPHRVTAAAVMPATLG
jgi:streptogramin lyase